MNANQNNGVETLTVKEVMLDVGIKARATVDKYIAAGVLKPIKKRGKQPETYRGRKFMFKRDSVEKLKKYMLKHGRIQPKGLEPVQRPVEYRKPRKQAEVVLTKETLAQQLNEAIKKVEYLETAVKLLSKSIREMSTTH